MKNRMLSFRTQDHDDEDRRAERRFRDNFCVVYRPNSGFSTHEKRQGLVDFPRRNQEKSG
jgi:hypothetical protein